MREVIGGGGVRVVIGEVRKLKGKVREVKGRSEEDVKLYE